MSGVAIMRYEKGQREPNKEVLEKISLALDVPPAELMGWDDFDKKHNANGEVTREVKAVGEVNACFGNNASRLLEDFISLNDMGQIKALDYVSDLSEHEKYRK